MKYETINLKNFYPLQYDTKLICYALDNSPEIDINRKHQAVLVLPGGAYCFLSDRESEPICTQFLANDMCAFILKYTVAPNTVYPNAILDSIAALAYLKKNAHLYNIDPEKISVIGFSAGGHLAATLGAFYKNHKYLDMLKLGEQDVSLYSCILSYPVISFKDSSTNGDTCANFTKGDDVIKENFSIEDCVNESFPRTFVWATRSDAAVKIENTLALVNSLQKHGVEYEAHIYPHGPHGLSLAKINTAHPSSTNLVVPSVQSWINMSISFLKHEE